MTYVMRLTETASGRSVEREYPNGYSEFWWTDGNFGCDCNRRLEFMRATGASEEEIEAMWDEIACGDSAFDAEYVGGDVAAS